MSMIPQLGPAMTAWQGGHAGPTPTFPTTPTPPAAGGTAGFVRILGTSNSNSNATVNIPVGGNVRAGRNIIVWCKETPDIGHATTAPIMTGVTDTLGSTYTLHQSPASANPQGLAIAKLATPLLIGEHITVTFTRALTVYSAVTVIAAVYYGIGTFTRFVVTRFGPGARKLTFTVAASTTGYVLIGGWAWGNPTTATPTVTATFKRRITTRWTPGPKTNATIIHTALADSILPAHSGSLLVSVTWSLTGHLGLWAFKIA